nr:glycosyltransferase [Bacillus cereus]
MNKVSVIVPIYNAGRMLEKCISSILNQTFNDFELILVNDGSTDNSLEICNIYKKKDKRITVISKKTKGVLLQGEGELKLRMVIM